MFLDICVLVETAGNSFAVGSQKFFRMHRFLKGVSASVLAVGFRTDDGAIDWKYTLLGFLAVWLIGRVSRFLQRLYETEGGLA